MSETGALKVFLTGASSGIGEALARLYAKRGAKVGLFARRTYELERVAASLPPGSWTLHPGDVRDASATEAAAQEFIRRVGVPDIVIANAGISRGTSTGPREDLAAFREVIETNVLGVVHTFAPFVEAMRLRRSGRLVGIASVAGFRGLPGSGAYSASKAATITYLESLRVELRGTGVDVLTVCPGWVATPLTAKNPYRMPFLLGVEKAAELIVRAIDRRARFYVLPRPMAAIGAALRALPRPIYDLAFARAPRKPRRV